MKMVLLITLIGSLSVQAGRTDYSSAEILQLLKVAEGKIDPLVQKMCEENLKDISIDHCGKKSSEVLGDYVTSVLQLNHLRNQVRIYGMRDNIRSNLQRKKRVDAVAARLQCIRKDFDNYKISCECGEFSGYGPTLAYVIRAKKKVIQLCPAYFKEMKRKDRSAVLLHEVSHMCGTEDWIYLGLGRTTVPIDSDRIIKAGTLKTVRNLTAHNADNFRYWAVKGFCLPDYDCEKARDKNSFTEELFIQMQKFIGR